MAPHQSTSTPVDVPSTGMHIAVIGSGYVGTTLGASLANLGHRVSAIDIDETRVQTLNAGEAPIHEPGLDVLIAETAGDRLTATTDYEATVDADLVFVAVPTPSNDDGSIDVSALRGATLEAAKTLLSTKSSGKDAVIVIKSTVTPPQLLALRNEVEALTADDERHVEVAANPEFLREGTAVADFQEPDKLVFGVTSDLAERRLTATFQPIIDAVDPDVITTDPETAAMIKYANNAFLAAKISLINDLGNICKAFGIDAYEVAEAIGTDHRISAAFLQSGVGWGGSCFPKDTNAIIAAAREAGYSPAVLEAAITVNQLQPERLLSLLDDHLDVDGARIAVLGLAFKPGTDDIRHSRAIPIIDGLQTRGAEIVAYDPVAMENMKERFPALEYATSASDALAGADGAVVVTNWDEFGALDEAFDTMAQQIVIDGRRIISPREGMTYEGLTW